jgi:hypothetical protein
LSGRFHAAQRTVGAVIIDARSGSPASSSLLLLCFFLCCVGAFAAATRQVFVLLRRRLGVGEKAHYNAVGKGRAGRSLTVGIVEQPAAACLDVNDLPRASEVRPRPRARDVD